MKLNKWVWSLLLLAFSIISIASCRDQSLPVRHLAQPGSQASADMGVTPNVKPTTLPAFKDGVSFRAKGITSLSPVALPPVDELADVGRDVTLGNALHIATGMFKETQPVLRSIEKVTYGETRQRWPELGTLATIADRTPVWVIELQGIFSLELMPTMQQVQVIPPPTSKLRVAVEAAHGYVLAIAAVY